MRIAKIILGAACALFTLTGSAQQAPSSAAVANATNLGTAMANQMRGLSLQRDSSGQPVLNPSGSLTTTQTSSQSQKNDLAYFQNVTGLSGVEQIANPGNGQTGLVNLAATQTFDLSCSGNPAGTVRAAGGLSFKLQGCGNLPVQSIAFSICDAPGRASTCQPGDYSQNVSVPVGSFVTVSGSQVGAGCNSQNVCRITVKTTSQFGGDDTSLKAQAPQAAAQSSMVSDLRTTDDNGAITAKTSEIGQGLINCASQTQQSLQTSGTVAACGTDASGHAATVTVASGGTAAAAACNGPRTCIKQGTTTQNFTRSCTRTFPLTERITQYSYQTAQCDMTSVTAADGTVTVTNSCVNGAADQRTGMSQVGTTDKQCVTTAADGSCTKQTWTEYWASSTPAVVSTQDSPSAVAGACDTGPLSETSYTGFSGGVWFGRTLPDSECVVQTIDESTNAGTGTYIQLTNADKAGCGIYTTPSTGVICYGQPSAQDDTDTCSSMDLSSCTLTSSVPASLSSGTSGIVTSQTETYSCQTQQTTCLQYSTGSGDNACLDSTNQTFGSDKSPNTPNDGSGLNAALVAAAIVDGTSDGVDPNSDPTVPRIFTGDDMRCSRATGGIGQLFGRNCCRTDLQRPVSGQLIRGGCNMNDVKLAAARRSNYSTYIGTYCSKRMRFPRKCLEETETYCTFNGVLPRLVQEQGRVQLAQMAASGLGASVQHGALNYPYLDSGTGKWTPAVMVNGVELHAWQWPSYCADPNAAADYLQANPDAYECPGVVTTYVAACDNGACGALPPAPEYGAGAWSLIQVNPLENNTTAVSRYAVVSGACATTSGLCQYAAAAWPAGQGGKAVITRDINWPLYSNQAPTSATAGGSVNQMSNVADLVFRPWSQSGMSDGKTMPATVRVDFSTNGGQSWSIAQVPTNLNGADWQFPDSSGTRISGSCDLAANLCNFRVTGTTTITAKPWGGAEGPDCSGYTAGQLSAMDFSKMDLSEFLSSVMAKTNSALDATTLASNAASQAQQFNSMYANAGSGATLTATSPVPANFARMSPSQGFGPFKVTLVVSGFWPQTTGDASLDKNRVTNVTVDWGDCTLNDTLLQLDPSVPGSGYSGTHTFDAPDKLKCGAKNGNVTQTVTVTAYTSQSGVQKRTLSVENAWATFPGGSGGQNDTVPVTTTVPLNKSQ